MKLTPWASTDRTSNYRVIGPEVHWWAKTGLASLVVRLWRWIAGVRIVWPVR